MNDGVALDPAGHLKLSCSNLEKSFEFYNKLFAKLKYEKIEEKAWKTKEGFGIWLTQAKLQSPACTFSAPGLHHLCFKAKTPEMVDAIYAFLLKEKAHVFDSPQHYPEYTSKYYAVFFADPDGIKLETAYY